MSHQCDINIRILVIQNDLYYSKVSTTITPIGNQTVTPVIVRDTDSEMYINITNAINNYSGDTHCINA